MNILLCGVLGLADESLQILLGDDFFTTTGADASGRSTNRNQCWQSFS